MTDLIERYKAWHSKLIKNLQQSKGSEGTVLLSRFERLALDEQILGVVHHAKIMHSIVKGFSEERQNLRWVEKLVEDCERWHNLFESILRLSDVSSEEVVEALVSEKLDVDFAIGLLS